MKSGLSAIPGVFWTRQKPTKGTVVEGKESQTYVVNFRCRKKWHAQAPNAEERH
jgi:hypothetical protein